MSRFPSPRLIYSWLIAFSLLILYFFSLILFTLILIATQQATNWSFLELMVSFLLVASCATIIVLVLHGLVPALLFLHRPSKYLLEDKPTTSMNKTLEDFVSEVAVKINVRKPEIKMILGPPAASTFGIQPGTANLVVSDKLVDILDKDELEAVIAHELFHIKYGEVVNRSVSVVANRLFKRPLLPAMLSFLLLSVVWGPILQLQSFLSQFPPNFLPFFQWTRMAFFAAIPCILFVIILTIIILMKSSLVSKGFIYVRELLADGFSATITGRPMKLYSAILKISGLNSENLPGTFGSNLPSKQKSTKSARSVTFSRLINPERNRKFLVQDFLAALGVEYRPVFDRISYRLDFLRLIDNIISRRSKLAIIKFSPLKLEKTLPDAVSDFVRSNRAGFAEFLKYSADNANSFSLIACCDNLKIHPHEAFLHLWAAVYEGKLDLVADLP